MRLITKSHQPHPIFIIELYVCQALFIAGFVEDDGEDDDDTFGDLLVVSRDVHEVHSVVENTDDQCADDRALDGTDTAGEAGTADDSTGDGVHFISQACGRLAGAEA